MISTIVDTQIEQWLETYGYKKDIKPYIQYIWYKNSEPNKFWMELKTFLLNNYYWSSSKKELIGYEVNKLVEMVFEDETN